MMILHKILVKLYALFYKKKRKEKYDFIYSFITELSIFFREKENYMNWNIFPINYVLFERYNFSSANTIPSRSD